MAQIVVVDSSTLSANLVDEGFEFPVVTARLRLDEKPNGVAAILDIDIEDAPADREEGVRTRPDLAERLVALISSTFRDHRVMLRNKPLEPRADFAPRAAKWGVVHHLPKSPRLHCLPRIRSSATFDPGAP